MKSKRIYIMDNIICISILCFLVIVLFVIISLRVNSMALDEEPNPEINKVYETSVPYEYPVPEPVPLHYTSDDVYILAQAMTGECYESEWEDMINVGMTICNRVDDPRFPDTFKGVITQPNQIHGYYRNLKPSETSLLAAAKVLGTWNAIKNGDDRPWNYDILFWSAGGGKTNVFRGEY